MAAGKAYAYPLKHAVRQKPARPVLRRQGAVLAAEREVDRQADQQPDEKPHPGLQRQRHHQHQAEDDREHRQPRRPGHAEAARAVGLGSAAARSRPTETTMNANSVPMLARSANVPMSQMPAGMPTARPGDPGADVRRLVHRVHLGERRGSSPSRDMANQMRACPY